MTNDNLDGQMAEGFSKLALSPDAVARMKAMEEPRRSPWGLWGVAAAAAAVLVWVAWPLLSPEPEVASAAPEVEEVRAPMVVPDGLRAVAVEADGAWPTLFGPGARVDMVSARYENGQLTASTLLSGVEALSVADDGVVTLAVSPEQAEQLMVAREGGAVSVAVELGGALRAYVVEVEALSVRSGMVTEGSRVDVLLTHYDQGTLQTVTLLEDVLVIEAHDDGGLALTLSPRQVERVAVAREQGKLSVTLR